VSHEQCGCVGEWLCFRHKLAYWREGNLNISPAATPSRRNNKPTQAFTPKNSWERGIAKDERGMPYLRPEDLQPMGVHEFASRRHEFDEGRKKLKAQAPTPKDS
jgi:hypothetical protein